MMAQRQVLLTLLRLTQSGPVKKDSIARAARVPVQSADEELEKLSRGGLIYESEGVLEALPHQRIRMALCAVRLGVDFKQLCDLLSWSEFEKVSAEAFEANNYRVVKNLRFTRDQRKWEIDIVALKQPIIVCVDCKHWKHGWRKAATEKAAEAQAERTKALAEALYQHRGTLGIRDWKIASLVPVILSLTPNLERFYEGIPIVQILQLQDFISELPAQVGSFRTFHQNRIGVDAELTSFSQ